MLVQEVLGFQPLGAATASSHANPHQMTCSSNPAHSWAQRPARGHVLLLCALTACNSLLPLAAAALPFQQQAVDWNLVPTEPEAAANLSTSCICALLNGTCTPGCCCDTACPTELIAGFKAAGNCMPEGPPPQQLPYCVPAEPFAKVRTCGGAWQQACVACRMCMRLCPHVTHSSCQVDVCHGMQAYACHTNQYTAASKEPAHTCYASNSITHPASACLPTCAGQLAGRGLLPPAAACSKRRFYQPSAVCHCRPQSQPWQVIPRCVCEVGLLLGSCTLVT
jgi:hypothetical protein